MNDFSELENELKKLRPAQLSEEYLGRVEKAIAEPSLAGETVETVSSEYQLSAERVHAALVDAAHVAAHLPPAVRQAS